MTPKATHDHHDAESEHRIRTEEVIGALSLAADLSMGLPAEHALRSCSMGMQLARHLELPPREQVELYYATLLVDAGCTAWASRLASMLRSDENPARQDLLFNIDPRSPREQLRWLARHTAPADPLPSRVRLMLQLLVHRKSNAREGFRDAFEVARRFAERLGMPEGVQDSLRGLVEHWDIDGPAPAARTDIPLLSRVVFLSIVLENVHRSGGRDAAERVAKERAGTLFDARLVDAFLELSRSAAFWSPLEESQSVWDHVQGLEPESELRYVPAERLPGVAESFADFVDLKAPHTVGHSRRVADLAGRIARRMMLPPAQIANIRVAALTHDLGLVAMPSFTLCKPQAALTAAEWEACRMHPYYGERILSRIPAMRNAAALVAAHHEREDGGGYYQGLAGARIPRGARVIAAADRFDELTHDAPGRSAVKPASALAAMRREDTGSLWSACVECLAEEVGASPAHRARRGARGPAGLTPREVEVLQTLCTGVSTRELARQLHISESTARHHLEHIYGKIGVTTRSAAVLFALEQGLLAT